MSALLRTRRGRRLQTAISLGYPPQYTMNANTTRTSFLPRTALFGPRASLRGAAGPDYRNRTAPSADSFAFSAKLVRNYTVLWSQPKKGRAMQQINRQRSSSRVRFCSATLGILATLTLMASLGGCPADTKPAAESLATPIASPRTCSGLA